MYYVYILKSLKDGKLYTGFTADLARRLRRHNEGFVASTRNRRPFKLIYYETYDSRRKAIARERYFKSLEGSCLKRQILDSIEGS